MSSQAYTPPQWANTPSMVSLTVPAQNKGVRGNLGGPQGTAPDGSPLFIIGTPVKSAPNVYVFDAVLDLEHWQSLVKTQHPIQTGADISSHAYLQPAKLTMYIGMSDAMAAYMADGVTPFSGASNSKSVNAYQTMLDIQAVRQPISITTRLRSYDNMLVLSVSPREDYKTITGLKMRVEFEQIYTASTSSTPNATRPDATQTTGQGTVDPVQVPTSTQQQFQIPQASVTNGVVTPLSANATAATSPSVAYGLAPVSMTDYLPAPVNVPGAGSRSYSSVPGQQSVAP